MQNGEPFPCNIPSHFLLFLCFMPEKAAGAVDVQVQVPLKVHSGAHVHKVMLVYCSHGDSPLSTSNSVSGVHCNPLVPVLKCCRCTPDTPGPVLQVLLLAYTVILLPCTASAADGVQYTLIPLPLYCRCCCWCTP
jgi:hypothetical protein